VANLFFKLLTSKFKFPIFRLTIAIVWKNSTTFYACITSIITFPTNFGVFVYVVGFLDPFANDRISCTNLLPNSNSNGNSLHILVYYLVPIFLMVWILQKKVVSSLSPFAIQ
jgi:hypothetical protein